MDSNRWHEQPRMTNMSAGHADLVKPTFKETECCVVVNEAEKTPQV